MWSHWSDDDRKYDRQDVADNLHLAIIILIMLQRFCIVGLGSSKHRPSNKHHPSKAVSHSNSIVQHQYYYLAVLQKGGHCLPFVIFRGSAAPLALPVPPPLYRCGLLLNWNMHTLVLHCQEIVVAALTHHAQDKHKCDVAVKSCKELMAAFRSEERRRVRHYK